MSPAGPHYGLEASARTTGGLRHAELAVFELLGSCAASSQPDRLATFLAGAALAHAWRAEQLAVLLPVSVGLPDAAACTLSPSRAFDLALETLAAAGREVTRSGTSGATELLEAIVLVLYPAFSAAYGARLASCCEAADAPLARALRRVQGDLDAVASDGSELLAGIATRRPAGSSSEPVSLAQLVSRALGTDEAPLGVPLG